MKDILEIGTYDGFNCLILKKLFPYAEIDTLDLAENDEESLKLYNRNNYSKKKEINENRSKNLSKAGQINFFERNSVSLFLKIRIMILIWIDGFQSTNCNF